jgi:hypothetical protein
MLDAFNNNIQQPTAKPAPAVSKAVVPQSDAEPRPLVRTTSETTTARTDTPSSPASPAAADALRAQVQVQMARTNSSSGLVFDPAKLAAQVGTLSSSTLQGLRSDNFDNTTRRDASSAVAREGVGKKLSPGALDALIDGVATNLATNNDETV